MKAVKKGATLPAQPSDEPEWTKDYTEPEVPPYHTAKWYCYSCFRYDGFFPNSGERHDKEQTCHKCKGHMVFIFRKDTACGRDQREWDERKVIDGLPITHGDSTARSPYEAAKIMEKHGLYTHPSDRSGTPVAVDYVPMDSPKDQITFDLPADMAARRGRKPVKGHKSMDQVKKNLGMD